MATDLLTCSQVQALLCRSRTTVRRYCERGLLRPGIDADGVRFFERGAVLRLRRRLRDVEQTAEVVLSGADGAALARALGVPWPCAPRALVTAAERLSAAAVDASDPAPPHRARARFRR